MTPLWIANNRMLMLADIIEAKDVENKEWGLPTYDQEILRHWCGTPACAIGHASSYMFGEYGVASREFLLSLSDCNELFSREGCGNAGSGPGAAQRAAAYIRRFVAARVR